MLLFNETENCEDPPPIYYLSDSYLGTHSPFFPGDPYFFCMGDPYLGTRTISISPPPHLLFG